MLRSCQADPPLGAIALYFGSPQTWPEDERAKKNPLIRHDIAWQRVSSRGVPVLMRRDGFLIFCFDQSPAYRGGAVPAYEIEPGRKIPAQVAKAERDRDALMYRRMEYANAFLLALTSAVSTVHKMGTAVQEPVDPWNYLRAEQTDQQWNVTTANTRYQLLFDEERPLVMDVAAFDDAVSVMDACEAAFGDEATLLLSMTYTACHQYGRHQFSSAHLIAWCVAESLVHLIWKQLLNKSKLSPDKKSGHTAINKDRWDQLTGRDFTASIITQMLSLSNRIDDELLTALDKARKARNTFAHKLAPITSDEGGKAIRLAADLITRLCGRRVTSQLSYSSYH